MTSLCITGSSQRTLDYFADALREAGANAAVPALRKEKLSIAQWHQKVIATHAQSSSSARLKPGRTWDQMAVDIFYANDKFPLWFWADESSVKVLNYWLEFDTATQFIFVHTPPQMALVTALEDGKDSLLALEEALQNWCLRTQAMLSAQLSHPERCVFIQGPEVLIEPAAHIRALAENWQLPLQSSQTPPGAEQADNALERYVLGNLLHRYPHAIELDNEVRARLLATPQTSTTHKPLILDQVLAELSKNKSIIEEVMAEREKLQEQLESTNQLLLANRAESTKVLNQQSIDHAKSLQLLKEKNAKALQQIELDNTQNVQKLIAEHSTTTLNAQIKSEEAIDKLHEQQVGLAQENTVLQAKLDACVLDHHQNIDTVKQAHAETLVENALLLNQLHYTQEDLEHYISADQDRQTEMHQLHKRIQRIFQRIPNYWEIESITAEAIGPPGRATIQWNLTNAYLNDYLIPTLSFQSRLTNDGAEILIQRPAISTAGDAWIRWPAEFANAKEFPCMPNAGGPFAGNNAILSGLSTSGWQRLQLLIKHLITHLENPTNIILPGKTDKRALVAGFKKLLATLANWPMVFRYDDVQLVGNDRTIDYQALGIRLSSLSLGEHSWPELEYRVSSVDQSSGSFGENPRLEFYENTRGALQHWFAESQDSKGAKLELRFAKPNAMDINVWAVLSETDRLLIAGLVGSLSAQLNLLQQNNLSLLVPWQEWQALGRTIREILVKNSTAVSKRMVVDVERVGL